MTGYAKFYNPILCLLMTKTIKNLQSTFAYTTYTVYFFDSVDKAKCYPFLMR